MGKVFKGKNHEKYMGTKLVLTFLFLFILIGSVSAAQDSLGTYAEDSCVDLLQICGTCTYNNITSIVLPNSSRVILDVAMTKRGTEYSYNYCNTGQIGTYLVNGVGDLDGTDNAWAYDFSVTNSGHNGIKIEWVLIFVLVLAYGLIIFGFSREEHPPITMGAVLLLLTALYIWMNGFGVLGTQNLLSQVIAAANFVVGAYLSIQAVFELNK